MGQYYMPIIFSEDGHKYSVCSHDYDNGLKLLEHSYVGNDFVNAVTAKLFNKKGRLAWVGDYSDDYNEHGYGLGGGFIHDHEDFIENVYSILWGDKSAEEQVTMIKDAPPKDFIDTENSDYYIVNHTKGIYLSLREFVELNKWHESYDYEGEHYEYDMCVHPLPLLTAVGNGQGGGDYRTDLGYELVGCWAFDTIEIVDEEPCDLYFGKVNYEFAKNV